MKSLIIVGLLLLILNQNNCDINNKNPIFTNFLVEEKINSHVNNTDKINNINTKKDPQVVDFLKPNNAILEEGGSMDLFGYQFGNTGMMEDNLILGCASGEDSDINGNGYTDGYRDSGALYVFEKNNENRYIFSDYIKAENPEEVDEFCLSVDINDGLIAVGAPFEDGDKNSISGNYNNNANEAGAVYLYGKKLSKWEQIDYLKSENIEALDGFGWDLKIKDDQIFISALGEDGDVKSNSSSGYNNLLADSGVVYVFKKNTLDNWVQTDYIKSENIDSGDGFGNSLDYENGLLIIGTPNEDGDANSTMGSYNNNLQNSGAVYIFEKNDLGYWKQTGYLKEPIPKEFNYFGNTIHINENRIFIVSKDNENADNNYSGGGAVYIYEKLNGIWKNTHKLIAHNRDDNDGFGSGIIANGDYVVIGATGEDGGSFSINGMDNVGDDMGTFYIFNFNSKNNTWNEVAYVKKNWIQPIDRLRSADYFGQVLGFDGKNIAIGSTGDSGNSTTTLENQGGEVPEDDPYGNYYYHAGAVYLFEL